jgi:hypothetical protein
VEPTSDDVLALVSRLPLGIAALGVKIAARHGHVRADDDPQPIGQWLADAGLSLSKLQKLVDQLVNDGAVVEVRGGQLWAMELPTSGTKAGGRYYLAPADAHHLG